MNKKFLIEILLLLILGGLTSLSLPPLNYFFVNFFTLSFFFIFLFKKLNDQKNGKFFFLHTPLGEHLFHSKSASSNYLKHKNSWEAVIRHHIFNVQKFNNDKEKVNEFTI